MYKWSNSFPVVVSAVAYCQRWEPGTVAVSRMNQLWSSSYQKPTQRPSGTCTPLLWQMCIRARCNWRRIKTKRWLQPVTSCCTVTGTGTSSQSCMLVATSVQPAAARKQHERRGIANNTFDFGSSRIPSTPSSRSVQARPQVLRLSAWQGRRATVRRRRATSALRAVLTHYCTRHSKCAACRRRIPKVISGLR